MPELDRREADAEWRGQVKALLEGIQGDLVELKGDHKARLNDHAGRIRSLEVWRGWVTGLGAAAGAASGWLAAKLGGHA